MSRAQVLDDLLQCAVQSTQNTEINDEQVLKIATVEIPRVLAELDPLLLSAVIGRLFPDATSTCTQIIRVTQDAAPFSPVCVPAACRS